jgi:hypothetical protein
MELTVYRGCDYTGKKDNNRTVFFSSSKEFATNYGRVNQYVIRMNHPFDTCSEENVAQLINKVGELLDDYSGDVYTTFSEYQNSGLLYHDTWEIFEPFINEFIQLGFDGLIIYEGGVKNYVTFSSEQFVIIGENEDEQ